MSKVLWLSWALVFAGLAGCVQEEAPAANLQTSAALAQPSGDHGALRGAITDDELVAVARADVTLVGLGTTTLSDEQGAFTLNDIAPGTHTLAISRLGYESHTGRVTIVAGQTTEVKVVLKTLAVVVPHVESFVDDGYIALSISGPSFYYFGSLVEPSKTSFTRKATTGAVTAITTAAWDQSTPATAKRLRLSLGVSDFNNWTEGKPGIHLRADNLLVKNEEKISITLFTAYTCDVQNAPTGCTEDPPNRQLQVIYQQKTRLYTNVFYVDPAPAGFTGLPS